VTNTPGTQSDDRGDAGTDASGSPGAAFFRWVRGLGLIRGDGWIGGVCGGVAARLGIDPIIVRGIAVVIAVLGGPALLFYAAAWLLLPDTSGRIHLEQLIRGVFDNAVVGIGILALLAFLPLAQGVWWSGGGFWGEGSWPQGVFRAIWTIVVIGLIVAFLIWLARRSHDWATSEVGARREAAAAAADTAPSAAASAASSTAAPAASSAPPAAPFAASSTASPSAAQASPPSAPPAAPPATPPAGASEAELASWREQREAWRQDQAAWRASLAADGRAIRAQRAAEQRAAALAAASRAAEARRIRRLERPRAGAAYVFASLGFALVFGALAAALTGALDAADGYAVPIGFATATATVGLAMIVTGALRRRSGFLGFVAIVLTVVTVLTMVPSQGRDLVLFSGTHAGAGAASVYQPFGSYAVDLTGSTPAAAPGAPAPVIDVEQGAGSISVAVGAGVTVEVDAVQPQAGSSFSLTALAASGAETRQQPGAVALPDGRRRTSVTVGSGAPDVIVRIEQGAGSVSVNDDERSGRTGGQGGTE
jgi:phage shock protein PspC (stress-responsive transcriptional regulator)